MARPANANSEATRERIIRAASELFAEHGRAGASVRAIAQTAEVNGAMISHYFGGKDGLYQECVASLYRDLDAGQSAFEATLMGGDSIGHTIASTVALAYGFARERRAAIRLVMRDVLDRGEQDPERRNQTLLPFLNTLSDRLAEDVKVSPSQIRLRLQSLIFLVVRYALSPQAEIEMVVGTEEDPHQAVTNHLVELSLNLLNVKEHTP